MKPSLPYTADELAVIEAEQKRLEQLIIDTKSAVSEQTSEAKCPVCVHAIPEAEELHSHVKRHAGLYQNKVL